MEHTAGPHCGSLFSLFGILRTDLRWGGRKIMTGYTVHTGSNDNFRDGWDEIFSDGKKKPARKKLARKKKTPGKSQARGKKSGKKKR
jgi:hypothetical protein